MWDMLGALHQNGFTQLLSCHVYQMLPQVVCIHIKYPTECSNWYIINCNTLMLFFPTCRNKLSESCPFCRGSLRRVNSEDLWVLTCNEDVVDAETVSKEDLLRFNLYINNLPKDHPDALFFMYYEYLI